MISVYGLICIVFVMNQVSSRCLITTTSTTIDVIDVEDFASPLLVHSIHNSVGGNANALAFDEHNERLYVGGYYGQIRSLKMMDICLAISTNSPFVPSTFIANPARDAHISGLAYDSEEKRLYSASNDTFVRTNIYTSIGGGPFNPSTPMTLTGESFDGGSLLESFDGSEGLYYLRYGFIGRPVQWMKISNYRDPSDSGSNAIQFNTSFAGPGFTGLTWLNENEVLISNYHSNNLYTLNINSEIPTQTQVVNLQGITGGIRGIHLFRNQYCTSLCSNHCPSGCGSGIADALLAATRGLDDASAAQTSANMAQTTADIAMQEIEKLKRILSDSSEEFNSFNAIGRALRDEKYVDNNEKHMILDVSESMMVAIFGMIVFINVLMCVYCNKKP